LSVGGTSGAPPIGSGTGYSPSTPAGLPANAASGLGTGTAGTTAAGVLGFDPLAIAVGGESITGLSPGFEQSGFGSSAAAAGGSAAVAPDQQLPLACPQLVFQPLVTGCQALLNQGTLGGLANTGSPILIALAGLLLIGTGSLVYRRSGAPAPLASLPGRGIARHYNGRSYGLNAVRRRLAWQRVQR
jgi:hypothetical protein